VSNTIYEIPFNINQLFDDVRKNDGHYSYRIIDYSNEMDDKQSTNYFVEIVGINSEHIVEDYGTQILLKHPKHKNLIVINSVGLGDFYSHKFECKWIEDDEKEYYYCANCGLPIEKEDYVCSGGCLQEMYEREMFS